MRFIETIMNLHHRAGFLLLGAAAAAALTFGCSGESASTAGAQTAEPPTELASADDTAAPARPQPVAQNDSEPVSVERKGTRFDPAVPASRVPEGAFICDMNGSVHFAALEAGDGNCPVCGMRLARK